MISRRSFQLISFFASALPMVLGAGVLLAWGTGYFEWVTVFPDAPAMVPWTAMSLLLLGGGMILAPWRKNEGIANLVRVFGVVVICVQIAFLSDSFGWSKTRLHRTLFPSRLGDFIARDDFGRSSPQTSLCLICLGLFLLLFFQRKFRRSATELLAGAPIAICFVVAVGYLFRALPFFTFTPGTGMAVHTALGVFMLCVAGVSSVAGPRFRWLVFASSGERATVRNLIVAALTLPLALSLVVQAGPFFGLYDSSFAHATYVVLITVCFGGLIRFAVGQMRQNTRLENAARVASAANAAKTQFLAHMSHEIRTPLNSILGFSELLKETDPPAAERAQYLETVLRNGRQLTRVIDQILDLSRSESGRLDIETVTVFLTELLSDVRSSLGLMAREKGLEFAFEVANDVPLVVKTDELRLRQILMNLVGNAIKFTAKGSVKVFVSLEREDVEGCHLAFRVRDTGIGITSEEQKRLFQPFSQGDPSITRRFGGTGLGLSLSQRLAKSLGGDIRLIATKRDQGSEFLLTVIVTRVPIERAAVPQWEDHQASVGQPLRGLRVLIVDDSSDNCALLAHLLSHEGVMAAAASDGEGALKKAERERYDLILMDLQMPRMDGFSALRRLREEGCRSPVVAVTAHAMKGDREQCLASGFDEYLTKPVRRADLLRLMDLFFPARS